MARYTWLSYGGSARIWLAVVLLAVAACVVLAGARMPMPARTRRWPGRATVTFMIVVLLMALVIFGACVTVYATQMQQENLIRGAPSDPITPVTLIGAGIVFFIIVITSKHGWKATLPGGVIAVMAAPMIFELPFDLLVMARTYPPILPYPGLYRALFFLPLFLVEITALSFLPLSPMVRLSRVTFFLFGSMLVVFAAWSLAGFSYPSAPFPIAMNVISKLLALATALSLYLPPRAPGGAAADRRAGAVAGAESAGRGGEPVSGG
ncbi:MAG: hypothetical protein LBI49_06330 [Nocardiopsaceae bacterium]|jgi:hypothetical protein|nr:hypothetical protein [Nocardiopsaceae bacterium]